MRDARDAAKDLYDHGRTVRCMNAMLDGAKTVYTGGEYNLPEMYCAARAICACCAALLGSKAQAVLDDHADAEGSNLHEA